MAGAATPFGNMVIKLSLDDADFGKGVKNAKQQATYLEKEMRANMRIFDSAGDKMSKLESRYGSLTRVISAQQKQVEALKKAYEGSFEDGKATESTKQLAGKLQDANGKLAAYKGQLLATAGALAEYKVKNEGFTGAINKASDAMVASGEKMQSIGSAMTKSLTLPLAAGVTAVTKAAIDWESAFTGVKKTNDEIVDSNGQVVFSYEDLEKGLRDLAKRLPSSHSAIAEVAEAAGQLGIQTDNVVAFTKTMIDMGESTNLSADTAATSMAKFANITGMSQKEFSNLGSSLVALGNNFATTESDIMAMSMRLAGAGHQIGMSAGDITGLATALSSVGIEAEAGGSAMSKVMISLSSAVEKGQNSFGELKKVANAAGFSLDHVRSALAQGGKTAKAMAGKVGVPIKVLEKMNEKAVKANVALNDFATVAGKTDEQFIKMFKSNPAEALTEFIKGLNNTERNGKSAMLVLGDLGMTEVRLRDTLLRASGASGVFTDALKMGNKAYEENTALTNEASKRYETTESKLKMLKNEIIDVAIDLGGPFVDALRDGVQAAKPLIGNLAKMAKAFSNASPDTQKLILKLVALATVGGPALKMLGSLTSGVGKLGKGFVGLAANLAKKKAIDTAGSSLLKLGTSAATAAGTGGLGALTGGLSALGPGLAAIAGPATIAIGAVAAVSFALYEGKKAYDDHQLAGEKWGTAVTKEQDEVIDKSYEMKEKAAGYIEDYANGVVEAGKKAIKANEEIAKSIDETIKKEGERRKKALEKIEDEEIRKQAEAQNRILKERDKIVGESAKKTIDNINTIVKNAIDSNRKLTEGERQVIGNMYKNMSDKQLELAGFNKDQRLAIEETYQNKISKMTDKQLVERRLAIAEALDKENEKYEKQQEYIRKAFESNPRLMKKNLDKQEELHKTATENMILSYAKMTQKLGYTLESNKGVWEKYGFTVEEVQRLVNASAVKTTENLEMMAKGTSEFDQQWNMLALDPKTGEVRTNMADTLIELAKTKDGWDKLRLISKNADITTNAKTEIAIAMGQVGKWNSLELSEKKAMFNGDEAKVKMLDTISKMEAWNQYNLDRKEMGIENADAIWKLIDTKEKLEYWNTTPTRTKKMLADNSDLLAKIATSDATLKTWNQLPVEAKSILAYNGDLLARFEEGKVKMDHWNLLEPEIKYLQGDATSVELAAQNGGRSLNIYDANNPAAKVLAGNSSNVQNEARTGVQSLNVYAQKNPSTKYLTAIDNASGPAYEATRAAESFRSQKNHKVTFTTVWEIVKDFFSFEKGTNFHTGGPAMVNDQKGSLYRELIQTPDGRMFLPQGRNVIMDLPRGTKVYNAKQTKRIIPHYEKGVSNKGIQVPGSTVVNDFSELSGLLKQMLDVVARLKPEINVYGAKMNDKADIRQLNKDLAFLTQIEKGGF